MSSTVDGELATVQSRKNTNHAFWNFANHFTYNAAGAVTSNQLGNGRWESTQFNSRLQPTQIALGSIQNGTDKLKLDYEYGDLYPGIGVTDFTKNNGNVSKQTITVGAVGASPGFVATQYYAYDSLNRIEIATENVLPDGATDPEFGWRQHFKFDRYGNRNFVTTGTTVTTTLGTCPAEVCNPSINPNNNKISSAGYEFDDAGNTIGDASNRKFTYDSDNKQVKVETASGQTVTGTLGEYWYGGDGKRVKKRAYENDVPAEETIFVYDAGGRLVGEYTNEVASQQNAKVAYLTNDHLGSPRINTDVNGNVTARHDYHPFGEEVASSARSIGLGYADDTLRKQFTGYERDSETGLDFAEARSYSYIWGRFVSPDPSRKSIQQSVPQSWNRYSYCYNLPLNLVDKNGKWPTKWHDYLIAGAFKGLSTTAISVIQAGSYHTDMSADGKPVSTAWPSEAYKHAMTPWGMTPEGAREKAWGFLKGKLEEIKSVQRQYEAGGGTGLSLEALGLLGQATHVYEDATSPEHGFDKVYGIPLKTVTITLPDGSEFSYEDYDLAQWQSELNLHSAGEDRQPTELEAAESQLYSRAFFLVAFGEVHFRRLEMSDEERQRARDLADRYRNSR